MCEKYPETYPAKVLFEIFVGSELRTSVGMSCEPEAGTEYCSLSPEEQVVVEGVATAKDLSMRVTVTDRKGNEFVETWAYADEEN